MRLPAGKPKKSLSPVCGLLFVWTDFYRFPVAWPEKEFSGLEKY
jgi:hypothetical protein